MSPYYLSQLVPNLRRASTVSNLSSVSRISPASQPHTRPTSAQSNSLSPSKPSSSVIPPSSRAPRHQLRAYIRHLHDLIAHEQQQCDTLQQSLNDSVATWKQRELELEQLNEMKKIREWQQQEEKNKQVMDII